MLGSPSDAAPFVADQVGKCEASYIKLFHELGDTLSMDLQRPPLDVQRAVVEAAHDHGLIAVGHALSHAGVLDLLSVGVDGLAHIFLDKPPNDDWIRIMKERNVHCNPTLSVCASLTGEGLELQRRFVQDPLAKRMLFNDEPRGDIGLASQCKHASIGHAYENAAALYYAGVPLIVGSDSAGRELGSAYGMGLHMEMYRMVHGVGMKPEDVLRGGTSLIAERFGFEDRGRIQEGARADLVLVNGDVRKCLSDEDSLCLPIKRVWRQGIMADVYQN
jgi:imidazolonepropionase-like amidohydrolase